MSYDHWKTTEPESGYDPPEPPAEDEYERALGEYEDRMNALRRTALKLNMERIKYEAALRKIAGWQGYNKRVSYHDNEGNVVSVISRYEEGANDMLETLADFAKEALA